MQKRQRRETIRDNSFKRYIDSGSLTWASRSFQVTKPKSLYVTCFRKCLSHELRPGVLPSPAAFVQEGSARVLSFAIAANWYRTASRGYLSTLRKGGRPFCRGTLREATRKHSLRDNALQPTFAASLLLP